MVGRDAVRKPQVGSNASLVVVWTAHLRGRTQRGRSASGRQPEVLAYAGARDARDDVVESLRPIASIDTAKATFKIIPLHLELRPAVWMCSSLRGLSLNRHRDLLGQAIRHRSARRSRQGDFGPLFVPIDRRDRHPAERPDEAARTVDDDYPTARPTADQSTSAFAGRSP
jgi:hypothetical protein